MSAVAEPQLLSIADVTARLNVSSVTLWRMEKRGEFPKALTIGKRCKRWRSEDIDAFVAAKAGGGR